MFWKKIWYKLLFKAALFAVQLKVKACAFIYIETKQQVSALQEKLLCGYYFVLFVAFTLLKSYLDSFTVCY